MAVKFDVTQIQQDLDNFQMNLESIDMDSVKQKVLKRIAAEMAKMVRQAVIAENDITTPSINSKYGQGSAGGGLEGRSEGPSMSNPEAWQAIKTGTERWTVRPHPDVAQRAYVLNFGWGTITPDGDGPLRFMLNGQPVFAESVNGPEATGYWQAAFQKMVSSEKLEEIGEEELTEELERHFR